MLTPLPQKAELYLDRYEIDEIHRGYSDGLANSPEPEDYPDACYRLGRMWAAEAMRGQGK